MAKIRVVLTDDSSVARGLLRSFLESDGGIEIVGEASNGAEAVRLVGELRPDLVTMDLEMPVMGGMDAIREIMATHAVPILVVSSVADAKNACAAVACGALDAISKPEMDAVSGFVAKVKMLAKIPVITHLRLRASAKPMIEELQPPTPAISPSDTAEAAPRADSTCLFAIASSTGGPQVLSSILGSLPRVFPCPILIAQHIADGFAHGMAEWLAGVCKLPVRLAREGELLMAGTVYVSPSEANLAVTPARRMTLVPRLPGEIYHPTCDVLLASVAAVYGHQGVGIILTGMGSDGAAGMSKIRDAGGVTLAQDETSSVIFGMNKVAIDRGGVQQVLPASEISQTMCRLAGLSV